MGNWRLGKSGDGLHFQKPNSPPPVPSVPINMHDKVA
jgi:hypothetical protein